jgi:hypothetical protein
MLRPYMINIDFWIKNNLWVPAFAGMTVLKLNNKILPY